MATLSISWTVPDNQVASIKDDFAQAQGWTANIQNPANPTETIPNPESQNAFLKRNLGEYIKSVIRNKRVIEAREAAIVAENASVDSSVVLT